MIHTFYSIKYYPDWHACNVKPTQGNNSGIEIFTDKVLTTLRKVRGEFIKYFVDKFVQK